MRYILALILIIPSLLFSQGGSNYSSIGLGDINTDNGAVFSGMAGTSIAVPNDHNINNLNTALWSKLKTTRIQMGYFFNQSLISTADFSLAQNYGKVDGISIVFMMDTANGLAAGMGFNSFSVVNYQVSSEFASSIEDLSVSGKIINTGFGGVTNAYFGLTGELFDMLSLSIRPGLYFGSISKRNEIIVNEVYGNDSETLRNDAFRSFNFKSSMYLELPFGLNVGAFYDLGADIDVNRETSYEGFINTSSNFRIVSNDTLGYTMPSRLGIGLSYKTGKFLIAADYETQDYSSFQYNPNTNSTYNAMTRYSIGFERVGNKRTGADLLDKWDYRFGLGYKVLPMEIQGEQITDMFASFGTSIPFGVTSYLDLGLMAGTRGQSTDLLVNESYMKMFFNLSIGETWFKPFARDFDDIED